jgi:uncharacterized LabA/DUF88 family protein
VKKIEGIEPYEIRTGRLIKSVKSQSSVSYRQKGVDVFISTDLVAKACSPQYDPAVLRTGDDDLLDAVKAVKEMGRRVHGVYFPQHI